MRWPLRRLQGPRIQRVQFPLKPREWPRPFPKGTSTIELTEAMKESKPHLPVGGRLKHFVSEWYKITSDPRVLDIVKGMHIDLNNILRQRNPPFPLKLSRAEIKAADDQIKTLLKKWVIIPASRHETGQFISTVFL